MKILPLLLAMSLPLSTQASAQEAKNHQMEVMKRPLRVETSQKLDLPADKVWKLIAGFNTLPDYHAAITTSELFEGGVMRKIGITEEAGGGFVVERLMYFNQNTREFSYKITELIDSPLPFGNYQAFVHLEETGENTCTLHWGSSFDTTSGTDEAADEIARIIYQGCYDGILKALK